MTENKSERKKIKVASVGTPRDVGDKGLQVTQFKGADGVTYECWSPAFMEHIKVDAEIDADIVFTQVEKDEAIYKHNKVVQLYQDGEPVKKKSAWKPGGYSDSPETRASIESQKAADITAQLWIGGKLTDKNPLISKLINWLESKLDHAAPRKTENEAPVVSLSKPQAKVEGELKLFENTGQFLQACLDQLVLNRTEVCQKLGVKMPSDIKDLDAAYEKLKEMQRNSIIV